VSGENQREVEGWIGQGKDAVQVAVHKVDEVDEDGVKPDTKKDEVLDTIRLVLASRDLLNRERDEKLLQFLHARVDLVDERPEVLEKGESGAGAGSSTYGG
jgi:hypothetical protein